MVCGMVIDSADWHPVTVVSYCVRVQINGKKLGGQLSKYYYASAHADLGRFIPPSQGRVIN